ncbi:8-amino-7-oxononanoate synthase [Modestobacter sp. KNN46-3]|jgi:8-amino-7-oxononanoate synthase|uniref:8-amino-7-oxononanoate synthase n=1 Tax=Modestobacter sp. KNN46-3 TaxID=2711218 RepID=UPI0013E0A814|nr:8-amino-7-oxononanoate synthase [Modestobacter sp. KNN46-3]
MTDTHAPATAGLLDRLRAQAAARAAAGLTRSLRPRTAEPRSLDLAGNDYLGLATHPEVTAAAAAAAHQFGAGAGASRLVTGTLPLHTDLEQALAEHCRQPAGLVFSSGYLANLGAVTALAGPDTLIVSDAHIHASLVDACRLARARVQVVPHVDVEAVEVALAARTEPHAVVLAESVYSVLGDAAPLTDLVQVIRRHDGLLLVDEAHGLGVRGNRGQGLVAELGLAGAPDVIVTATLSKALGSQGGAVLAAPEVIEHLINTARPFIFDTGLNPPAAAAALAALHVLQREPDRVTAVGACAQALAAAAGVPAPAGAVLSVPMPSPAEALAAAEDLAQRGLRVGCFRPPSTPDGISRLRLTAHATLDDAARTAATEALRAVLNAPELR